LAARAGKDKIVGVVYISLYVLHILFLSVLLGRSLGGCVLGDLVIKSLGGQCWGARYCAVTVLVSLRGIPPLVGFFRKFLVVGRLVSRGLLECLPGLFVGAVVRTYFYLRIGFLLISPSYWV